MAKLLREPNGTFATRLSFGRDPVTKKQIRKYKAFPGVTDEAQAQALADAFEASFSKVSGSVVGKDLPDALLSYISDKQARKGSPTTAATYRSAVENYVRPSFSDIEPMDVEAYMVDNLYTELLEHGGRKRQGLAPSTVLKVHGLLRGAWRWFIKQGIACENPVLLADPPDPDDYEAVPLDESQLAAVLEAVEAILADEHAPVFDRNAAVAVRIALATGMRVGEECALIKPEVYIGRGFVHVRANAIEDDGKVERRLKTKGKKSRNVKFAESLGALLEEHFAWQRRTLPPPSERSSGKEFVLTDAAGAMLRPSSVSKWFKRLARSLGFPEEVKYHSLRHTHASLLLAEGVDLKTIAARLGHARESLTLEKYSHVMPGSDEHAAETFGEIEDRARKAGDAGKASEDPEADP